jgi:1,4-alpha-glucan branching enzyme
LTALKQIGLIFMIKNQFSPRRRQKLFDDRYLAPHHGHLEWRRRRVEETIQRLTKGRQPLANFANGHLHFGLHCEGAEWVFREWAPNATAMYLTGSFTGWQRDEQFRLQPLEHGQWEIRLPFDRLQHGDLYRLLVVWDGGEGDRIPTHARRVVQDMNTNIFNAQVWHPESPYTWLHDGPQGGMPSIPFVYEAHVGMAQEAARVGTYSEFRENTLPRIVDAGYNTIQLMAVMEHPYYGSFGYHVSNFFAASSRFGTPEELKALVDAAHEAGLAVIMDLVHSHAVSNEIEGLGRFDGTAYQFFHEGGRGMHPAWGSCCFDYSKPEVLHFLLSNCRFWLDEYRFDGFRFDGITSMLYHDHGLGANFTDYSQYFNANVDEDALSYLALANRLIHEVNPDAITVAEDMSGMPGLGAPENEGGAGFDFRLAMGVPDCWFKLLSEMKDEDWNMNYLFHELRNRRADECTISYAESHDQAIVGGKTVIFQLIDAAMYWSMRKTDESLDVDRGLALHKMVRLITAATAGHGYLNFMGNEFGHPEWIDFPREGNGWSYHYARRQWSLRDNPELRYHFLADFDRAMVELLRAHDVVGNPLIRGLLVDNVRKVIVFERGNLFFFFNFHASESYADFGVEVPPGSYRQVLNVDATEFGGHGRVESGSEHLTVEETGKASVRHLVNVYLPCRSALVLER